MLLSLNIFAIPVWWWINNHLRKSESMPEAAAFAFVHEILKHR